VAGDGRSGDGGCHAVEGLAALADELPEGWAVGSVPDQGEHGSGLDSVEGDQSTSSVTPR
jgi:hypothetical protein